MGLSKLLVFFSLGLLSAPLTKTKWRSHLILIISVFAIYWLQPAMPIRNLDFWLPTASIAFSLFAWAVTRNQPASLNKEDRNSLLLTLGLIVLMGISRFSDVLCCLGPTRPPQFWQIVIVLAIIFLLTTLINNRLAGHKGFINTQILRLLLLLVVLKSESLLEYASMAFRGLTGQSVALASSFDIRWLGFSYLAFRWIHLLRDRLSGRLPELSLNSFLAYLLFFPALTAGPIDKIERFNKDLEAPFKLESRQVLAASKRFFVGLGMKFVLADGLALFALNPTNNLQTANTLWMWLLTYAYAFRIFFDFAGYTSIAIGLGMLFGIQLPENFKAPYLKENLTAFWNNWHITLAQWFRSYFFNPLTRSLRLKKVSVGAIVFLGQLGTMLLIGLWHGLSWNFAIWGLWHGLGLFFHNRWATFFKEKPLIQNEKLSKSLGVLLTFHYVLLGWVWFALPAPSDALHTFKVLFGVGP